MSKVQKNIFKGSQINDSAISIFHSKGQLNMTIISSLYQLVEPQVTRKIDPNVHAIE